MNRRDFVASVASALAVAAVPAAAKTTTTLSLKKTTEEAPAVVAGFDARKQYGMSVDFTERTEAAVAAAKDVLLKGARGVLPKGTRFYVLDGGSARVWLDGKPADVDVLAWYYSPTPLQPPQTYRVIAEVTA